MPKGIGYKGSKKKSNPKKVAKSKKTKTKNGAKKLTMKG
jgi:hypothetical protein